MRFQIEYCPLKRHLICRRFPLIHSEKLKVSAKIKNVKPVFILSVKQSRTKSCSSAYHLPKLCLTHNLLKEHQIQNLRHINACIEHIHGNGNLRELFRIRKFIDQALRIIDFVVNHLCKSIKMRIFGIENLEYFLGMEMIFCKYYGLSDLFTIFDFYSVCHENI